MQKPQHLAIRFIAPCNDPNIKGFTVWTKDDKAFLLVEIRGLSADRNTASLMAWSLLDQSTIEQPVISDGVYLYDDLSFQPASEQSFFPTNYKGRWYWAISGEVQSYEDNLTTELVLELERQESPTELVL